MAANSGHVSGVIDLTWLDIEDESQLVESINEKNPNNRLSLTSTGGNEKTTASGSIDSPESSNQSPKRRGKEDIKALRMSYNKITNMSILTNPFAQLLDPLKIQWLDLSFNAINGISETLIASVPNLTTLCLHANKISKLSDIKKLKVLSSLKSLSFYGNPVEENKHYKKYSLYYNPHLTQFDSSQVTKIDRTNVSSPSSFKKSS